ncbi:hypothetical protein K1719_011036 [Acacia pycnantha]|nr:hypothetical protein K1719_011036 [Acacia pycnantha]
MEPAYYNAAMEGNIDAFKGNGGEQIESILTPNKNTILHIHFTNYTQSVSETFVEKVLDMCPALLLKINVKDETVLHIAARYGHHKIVRKLIDCAKSLTRDIDGVGVEKILIRALNDKKDTALHEAARYGHIEVVEVLIEEEPDHSYFGKNDGGETPLYIAVERRYWNVVDTILDNSISPQYNGPNGRTALHAATIFGDEEKVSQLLTINFSMAKEADEKGWLPLHLAALLGNKYAVKQLVSEDRSTAYMRDKKGRTALHLAALDGNVSVMEIILKYCPDCCELVDEKGCNALHYTTLDKKSYVLFEEEKEILKNTPQMKNLCNEKDDDGNTPLHYIARLAPKWETHYNHALLERQFQGVVVDTMACNKYGQNPLDVAGAGVTQLSASENKLFGKLHEIGAMLGGRGLDKHLKEKEQEKRHDPTIDEKEKENKTNGDFVSGTAKSLSVVAILIATVTFSAGFTLPGGLNDKGSPILKYNAAFKAFVIFDSLSFIFSTSAILLLFLSSFMSNYSGGWIKRLPAASLLGQCLALTLYAMIFMIIAFGTGLYAVLGVSKGLAVVTLVIVLSFFSVIYVVLQTTFTMYQERDFSEIPSDRDLAQDIQLFFSESL